MKFGQHLKDNIAPEYGPEPYLAYERLDEIISQLSETKPSRYVQEVSPLMLDLTNLFRADETMRVLSLTAPPQTNAQGLDTSKVPITEEAFLSLLESEMVKVEKFTLQKVTELRDKISSTEELVAKKKGDKNISRLADEIANDFLRLELFVNINFMGFHKILKKHDKNLPNNPCKAFYVNRLHSQAWVRGDYSDIVVCLSDIYASLRDDHVAEDNTKDASQSFARSTTKYWVKTEDVSRVKYAVLRHLPVFLQKTSTGESDSQFTNSVYLDNDQLELYHGRLDKTPGAIALRLRWYGPGDPKLVFVERKTHNEKWTGEASIKERFIVSTVPNLADLSILTTLISGRRFRSPSSPYQHVSHCPKEARDDCQGQESGRSRQLGDIGQGNHSSLRKQAACPHHADAMHAHSLSDSL